MKCSGLRLRKENELKNSEMKYTVLLDPGHGKETPGKRSPYYADGETRFFEWMYNRKLVDKMVPLFEAYGIHAVNLVPEDTDPSLSERANRANKYKAAHKDESCLFISVHGNAAGSGNWMNAKGWSCWTTKGKTKSDTLAEALYDSFEHNFTDRTIRKDRSDGDRDYEANFTVIVKANMPAVLTENFFYDNEEESMWMMTDEAQERIAMATVEGVLRYFNLYEKK